MKKNKLSYFPGFLAFVLGFVLISSCQPEYEPEVIAYPEFSITDFTPKAGLLGEPLTITGTNFGDHVEAATISFNGVVVGEEDIVSYSDTEIVVNIPQEAVTGPIEVRFGQKLNILKDLLFCRHLQLHPLSLKVLVVMMLLLPVKPYSSQVKTFTQILRE